MAKKLWGGRFKKEIDKDFFEFQKSIQYDYKLAKYDIVHSLIHITALAEAGFLSTTEKNKLTKTLKGIRKEIKANKFKYNNESEDIHTDIQNKVEKRLGKLALKMHTLRSRNDQIVFDEKVYCYDKATYIANTLLKDFLYSIKYLGDKYKKYSIVGYTHTQRAQKVSFKEYMNAFYSMFERDYLRVVNFYKHIKIYIGAGALAGSPISKKIYNEVIISWRSKLLKNKQTKDNFFVRPFVNSLDNVSDRDFIIDFLSILSILQMHLSRLAEDFILYSTKEFNFVNLPEQFCTGSSYLPHKKNPDFLELVRGYTGRIYGNLISILTTMKGLPLTYNRDMQLDKEPLFSSVEIIQDELRIMTKFIKDIELNKEKIEESLKDSNLYAVKEAEEMVRNKKISFRQAHEIVGRKISDLEKKLAARPITRV